MSFGTQASGSAEQAFVRAMQTGYHRDGPEQMARLYQRRVHKWNVALRGQLSLFAGHRPPLREFAIRQQT